MFYKGWSAADTDVFPVVASLHLGGEKRRPEIRLRPLALGINRCKKERARARETREGRGSLRGP